MRRAYWLIEALIGALLVVAPFVEQFTHQHPALFTDVLLGIVVMFWAAAGYFNTWYLFEP